MKCTLTVLTIVLVAVAAGCGKTKESATEKVAERMIESAMEKDGTKAKVNLSETGAKITTTDAAGKTSQLELGTAQVTEADLGVPFYPGSKMMDGQSTRMSTPEGTAVTVGLQSSDPPAKVAGFYRERLKAQAEGKQFTEMSSGDGAVLALADDKSRAAIQIAVNKAENGSEIAITTHRGTQK